MLPAPSFIFACKTACISCYKIFLPFITNKFPYVILFSLPSIYLGNISEKIFKTEKKISHLIKYFFVSIIALLLLVFIILFPASYILSDIVPGRYQSVIIVVVGIYCCSWAFIIGNVIELKKIAIGLFYISVSLIIILNGFSILNQYKIISKYSSALDNRIRCLKGLEEAGNKKTVTLTPLPSSGFLYSAEISQDSSYFVNEHFKEGLFLSYFVKLKK